MRQNSRRSVPKYGAGSKFFLKKPPSFTFFQKSMPPAQKNEQECGAAGAFTAAELADLSHKVSRIIQMKDAFLLFLANPSFSLTLQENAGNSTRNYGKRVAKDT
ncbi:MAG: hypothetical protein II789_06070 [Clostridia bacterium]|nr:hypothetical protein [Clostridia bacterium]